VPASSWFAFGAGCSFTWMEPERHLVWIAADHADTFFGRVLEALDAPDRNRFSRPSRPR
jgi:hypothetical protein